MGKHIPDMTMLMTVLLVPMRMLGRMVTMMIMVVVTVLEAVAPVVATTNHICQIRIAQFNTRGRNNLREHVRIFFLKTH